MNMDKQHVFYLALWMIFLCGNSLIAETSWIIDSQTEWEQSISDRTGLEVIDGMASPTAENATFRSVFKTFDKKYAAKSLVIQQSPVWQNWESYDRLGPVNLSNAPVMLSVGPDEYWMFGGYGRGKKSKKKGRADSTKKFVGEPATLDGFDIPLQTTEFPNQFDAPGGLKPGLGGYHAWQSRDMVNWVHHGPVTEKFSRWVTTAEYADGKFYIYYDYPNDQDPHVYIDSDLTDGIPGEDMGMAFKDPTHGSDCAIIRDLDGAFHVIYEDWTPINARENAWDSPLAGHAVSADGIQSFKILPPAVDERTKPTGETATYKHPSWKAHPDWDTDTGEYQVHKPAQNAYGDWAAISIGGQYYLFGDYDAAEEKPMQVAWFTSPSLDQPFEKCGSIGEGHPDPDVCFAEGRFYLATQQRTDYVSDGPWVESVEVRVGVDVDKDNKVDKWTDWQAVKETYDYTPGFAKQVQKTPAAIDLSDLPAGFGYQFEVKIKDTTKNESKPILDKIQMVLDSP